MKKTSIKLLALVMAVLMLGAVCLTACTDSAAQDAAAAAQQTADEAKATAESKTTTAEVTAQIQKELAPYLKSEDAITTEAINSLIAGEIAKLKLDETYAKAADLDGKADKTALDGKADKTALDGKADKTAVDKKADQTAVKALEDKLKEFATSKTAEDLAAQIKTLTDSKIDQAKATELINTALANYVTTTALETKLTEYQKKSEAITAEDVKKLIKDAFDAFGVKIVFGEEKITADTTLDEFLKKADLLKELNTLWDDYKAGKTNDSVMLATIADAMSMKDWSDANDTVLSSIILVRETLNLLDKIDKYDEFVYTNDNKKEIDNKLYEVLGDKYLLNAAATDFENKGHFSFFKDENGKQKLVTEVPVTIDGEQKSVSLQTLLEYRLLRVATRDEMKEIAQKLKGILDVTTFEDELKALWASNANDTVKQIGELGAQVDYSKQALDYTTFSKVGTTQMVTIADKEDFYKVSEAYDALLVKYVKDKAFSEVNADDEYDALNALEVTVYYKSVDANPIAASTTYVYGKTEVPANAGFVTYTKLGETVTYDGTKNWIPATEDPAYNAKTIYRIPQTVKGVTLFTYVDDNYKQVINDFKTETSATYHKYTTEINKGIYAPAGYSETVAGIAKSEDTAVNTAVAAGDLAYGAVYKMLTECQYYIDLAYAQFVKMDSKFAATTTDPLYNLSKAFLQDDAFKDCKTVDDYVKALYADLYEPKDEEVADDEDKIWLDAGDEFADLIKNKKANVVTYMNEAMMINALTTETVDEIAKTVEKYDVYDKMLDEAYKNLFNKYRARAITTLEKIYNDYRSVYLMIDLMVEKDANTIKSTEDSRNGFKNAIDTLPLSDLLIKLGTAEANVSYAEGEYKFLLGFLNGKDVMTYKMEPETKNQYNNAYFESKVGFKLDDYFYAAQGTNNAALLNNGTTEYIDVNPVLTIYDNQRDLDHDLQLAEIKVKKAILAKDPSEITGDRATKNNNARKAFNEMVGPAFEYFNEIYYRYLFEDIKMSTLAKLYDAVVADAKIASANEVSGYVNSSASPYKMEAEDVDKLGYAGFFIPDVAQKLGVQVDTNTVAGINNRAVEIALQLYLTGFSVQGDKTGTTVTGTEATGKDFMVDNRTGVTKYDFDQAFNYITKGALYNEIKDLGANLTAATVSESEVAIAATAENGPLTTLATAIDNAIEYMEGVCIKFYFNTYMTDALVNLNAAHNIYVSAVDHAENKIADKNAMRQAIAEQDTKLTSPLELLQSQYKLNKDAWDPARYTEEYIKVLTNIVDMNDIKVALTGKNFEKALKDTVKSYTTSTEFKPVSCAETDVLATKDQLEDYYYAGNDVKAFEEVLNPEDKKAN